MRSQVERDVITVTIATSLVMLLGVCIVGAATVGLLAWAADLPEVAVASLLLAILAAAIWTSGSYLWRHRRP
jgi:hypothetical protein